MEIEVKCMDLDIVKDIFNILNEITKDERINPFVRNEYMDKINIVMEKER